MASLSSARVPVDPRAGASDVWQLSITPFPSDDPVGRKLYTDIITALANFNRRFSRRVPPLYRSGVRYVYEVGPGFKEAQQWFRDAPTIYKRGAGHCPGLTAWRLAELQEAGYMAMPVMEAESSGNLHALIMFWPPGSPAQRRFEDPSRILGMGA